MNLKNLKNGKNKNKSEAEESEIMLCDSVIALKKANRRSKKTNAGNYR